VIISINNIKKKYKKENKVKIERSNLEKYSEMFAYWFDKLMDKGI
jgi:hypothetical protein